MVKEASATEDPSVNAGTKPGKGKKNALKKLDNSLKLLRCLNDTTSRDEPSKYEGDSTSYDASANVGQKLTQFTSTFPFTIKCAGSEPSRYQHSFTVS